LGAAWQAARAQARARTIPTPLTMATMMRAVRALKQAQARAPAQ